MLKGGLDTQPLSGVLIRLGEAAATGSLQLTNEHGEESLIYLKGGLVYAVAVPSRNASLGVRLVSGGALSPEGLAEALEAQRTELRGWRLGELLIHLGYIEQETVENYVCEQLYDAVATLLSWTTGKWKFRPGKRTREDVTRPIAVPDLLAQAQARQEEWLGILAEVHGPHAIPTLSTRAGEVGEVALDPYAWSMLCKIDGNRSVAELAQDCGFTLFEAGQVLRRLVQSGLVDINENVDTEGASPVVEEVDESDEVVRRTSALAAALTGRGRPPLWPLRRAATEPTLADGNDETPEERRLRLRKAAAAELAASHAAAEEERRARLAAKATVDVLVEPDAAEIEARERAEAEARERAEAEARERVAAEESAWLEHERWLAEQRAAAEALERVAAEEPAWVEHAAWLAAERATAEEPAWADHAAWLTAERATAEEPAWADHAAWLEEHSAPEPAPEPESDPVVEPAVEDREPSKHEVLLIQRREALEEAAWEEHRAWLAAQAGTDEHQAHLEASAELTEWVSAHASGPASDYVFFGDPLQGEMADQQEPLLVPEPEPEPAREPEPEPAPLEPVSFADTASLLRELSSLQHDDSAPLQPPLQVTRPVVAPPPKKRKGLFGR